jgi:DGQHR domain-containing protein
MEVTAIKFIQNEKVMFFFVLEAKNIYNRFDVSRRIDDKEKGYQRSFSKTRINQIKKYLDKEKGILPNSILVNIDANKYTFSTETNKLTFVDEGALGFIIDGQHRVWGANNAEGEIFLPVVATTELSVQQQAQLFVKINKANKGFLSHFILIY